MQGREEAVRAPTQDRAPTSPPPQPPRTRTRHQAFVQPSTTPGWRRRVSPGVGGRRKAAAGGRTASSGPDRPEGPPRTDDPEEAEAEARLLAGAAWLGSRSRPGLAFAGNSVAPP